jgi:hypothetical protein
MRKGCAFPGGISFSFSAAGRLSLPAAENKLYKKGRGRKGTDAVKIFKNCHFQACK